MTTSLVSKSFDNELIVADQNLLTELTTAGAFLPYLQLYTTKSDAVTEGKIVGGHYGLNRDSNIVDLGNNVDVVIFTARPRAFQKDDSGEIIVIYDKDDPEYLRIQALQADGMLGCMAGPEILLWIPAEKCFATFFCGSKTLKREARKFGAFIGGKACNLRVKIIDNHKHKWHGPVISPCSTPPTVLPTQEEIVEQVHRFKNPLKTNVAERVEEGAQEEVIR